MQNSLARVVDPSVRRHYHITPTLKKTPLALPIHQRIHFKIASLTFKTLQNLQPSYLSDLLTPYTPSRNLRSLDKHLLTVPDIRSANGRRSFTYAQGCSPKKRSGHTVHLQAIRPYGMGGVWV